MKHHFSLESEEILLVPVSKKYAKNIFQEFTPEITKYMFPSSPQKIEETIAFINESEKQRKKGTDYNFTILKKDSGEFLGGCGIHNTHTKTPELGVWIKTSAHGNHYGKKAVFLLYEWILKNIEYEYILYPAVKENISSRKIPESLGGILFQKYKDKNQKGEKHTIVEYRIHRKKIISDKIQKGYSYFLDEPIGKNFDSEFTPDLTPEEMLKLGVFGGKYMTDCQEEFPKNWFKNAKLSPREKNPSLNFFGVDASLPLEEWEKKGWIYPEDPRGWFQWYCRYFMGRRIPQEDKRQIKRWKAIKRHVAAIQKNCDKGNLECRKKQRQAVLHWAYDARKL